MSGEAVIVYVRGVTSRIKEIFAPDGDWLERNGWRLTVGMTVGLLLLRIIYLIWLSPWNLIEDEAHYWDWSRHLSLSYYSKGPGVAWAIWASTALFGVSEWAIRLPTALAGAAATLALARLAMTISGGDQRVGFFAAAAFCLVPIFQVEAQVMTIDGPFVACWIVAVWTAWLAFERHRKGGKPWGLWALTGFILGVGFLFKYTMVLLPPAFLLYGIMRRHRLPWDRRLTAGAVLCAVIFLVMMSPVIIWNWQNGWPTLHHTLGHLGAPGGDKPTQWSRPLGGFSVHELLAAEVGVLGPPMFVLVCLAVGWAIERRHKRRVWAARLYLLICGLVCIGFFFTVALRSKVEGNWPIAGFTSLLVLVAWGTPAAVRAWHRRLSSHRSRASTRRRHRNTWLVAWRWAIGFGIATQLIILFPNYAAKLPGVGRFVPLDIVMGARELARRTETAARQLRLQTGEEPFVVVASAGKASQLAFYLEGRPVVYDAGGYIGMRPSAYDYFKDTDLRDPALLGRPAVLVNLPLARWRRGFAFDRIESIGGDPPIYLGFGYGGPLVPSKAYRPPRR